MVVKHCMAARPVVEIGFQGEPIQVRLGETFGAAFLRHQRERFAKRSNPAPAPAKPKVDPAMAKIRELQAEQARLERAVAAKEETERLTAKRDELERQLAEKERRERRGKFGVTLAGGGFKVFGKGK
jgi:predicted RNase H-like nuclease (RuvC/YqgF family)